jgi:regulator of sigma E protease
MDVLIPLLEILRSIVVFLIVITALVAVHELGHYLAARAFGMHVDAFAVMMGGVRKTDLRPHLSRPLRPAWMPWAAGVASGLTVVAGGAVQMPWISWAGLALLAGVLPIWVASRLEKLYHLQGSKGPITVSIGWLGSLAILFLGTQFRGVSPELVLGTLMAGGWVGALIVYYWPVIVRGEEGRMGFGSIIVPPSEEEAAEHRQAMARAGLDGHGEAEGRAVPVRFRPIWHWTNREGTEFSLLALPLGGFAAIRGMHPKEDGSEAKIEGGFFSKSPFARWATLFAGPLFSILFGVAVLTAALSLFGILEADESSRIGRIAEGSPAAKAGLREGDRIVAIDGAPVATFLDMTRIVRSNVQETEAGYSSQEMAVTFERAGSRQTISVLPVVTPEPEPLMGPKGPEPGEPRRQARLGIAPGFIRKSISVGEAAAKAAMAPLNLVAGLASVVVKPQEAKNVVGGPVSMAQSVSAAADQGIHTVLELAGLFSISLGVLNLLPIPPLDGGQMLIAFVEMLRGGRRLSLRVQQGLTTVGFLFMIALMVGASAVDLGRQVEQGSRLFQSR